MYTSSLFFFFIINHEIKFLQFGVPGNKEPFVDIPQDGIAIALKAVLDRNNHPMLIHCNKGKHRTGCLIGCLRKVQGWAFSSIVDEYIRYSKPKSRMMDQQFIELFDTNLVIGTKYPRIICKYDKDESGLDDFLENRSSIKLPLWPGIR